MGSLPVESGDPTEIANKNDSSDSILNSLPPPPVPASDLELARQLPPTPNAEFPSPQLTAITDDIFDITPLAGLKLLAAGIEALVKITGDIPPTPPPSSSYVQHMRGMQAEKENIARSHSKKNLSKLRLEEEGEEEEKKKKKKEEEEWGESEPRIDSLSAAPPEPSPLASAPIPVSMPQPEAIDGVRLRSPTSIPASPNSTHVHEPYIIIGADSQPLNLQHSAITRKFYSKKPPPIGISDYLLRIHRFCPMSAAVYLATSLYIHRLAVIEKAIAVTKRNAHRLLLAGLRVAMKALEDLSYPHAKIAKVGGVSDVELARLEISFCFLTSFELVVREEDMRKHWIEMKSGRGVGNLNDGGVSSVPRLRLPTRKHQQQQPVPA